MTKVRVVLTSLTRRGGVCGQATAKNPGGYAISVQNYRVIYAWHVPADTHETARVKNRPTPSYSES